MLVLNFGYLVDHFVQLVGELNQVDHVYFTYVLCEHAIYLLVQILSSMVTNLRKLLSLQPEG